MTIRAAVGWLALVLAIGLGGCSRADRVESVALTPAPAPAGSATASSARSDDPAPTPGADPVAIDVHCDSDADCAVKDIGSCCGAFPRCVNKDSPTDPAGVQARCAEQGRSGICGFPDVSGCQCQAHECVNALAPPPEASP